MAIIVNSGSTQQRQPERDSILQLLGRGLAEGAGKSLGTGLGNLATNGLGMLMDPNMRPMDAKSLEMMGLDPAQAQSIAAIKNPSVQQKILLAHQEQKAQAQEAELKQRRSGQYANQLNRLGPQQSGEGQLPPVTAEEVDALELADLKDLSKFAQKERGMSQASELAAHKALSPFIKETRDTARAEKLNKSRYDKILALDASGKVNNPATIKALKTAGLDWLMSDETQELQKLSTDFAIDFPKYTGGRVTNSEMAILMQRVPNLMQSPGGRKKVIGNLRKFADLKIKEEETLNKLLKEQGGKRTLDLEDRVAEKMAPEYEKFADKFVEELRTTESGPSQSNKEFTGGLPDPKAHAGTKVRNKATGQIMISDGTQWMPENAQAPAQPQMPQAPQQKKLTNNPFQIGDIDYGEY